MKSTVKSAESHFHASVNGIDIAIDRSRRPGLIKALGGARWYFISSTKEFVHLSVNKPAIGAHRQYGAKLQENLKGTKRYIQFGLHSDRVNDMGWGRIQSWRCPEGNDTDIYLLLTGWHEAQAPQVGAPVPPEPEPDVGAEAIPELTPRPPLQASVAFAVTPKSEFDAYESQLRLACSLKARLEDINTLLRAHPELGVTIDEEGKLIGSLRMTL